MIPLLAALCVASLAGALPADPPRTTNTLEFAHGGKLEVSYNQIDLGKGVTLDNLMAKNELGSRMRQIFNERGFKGQIAGKIEVATRTTLAGDELDPGTYNLSFRIDDDLIWHLVVLTEDDEEIFAAALDTSNVEDRSSGRLVLRPLAADNKKGTGTLELRFGKLSAAVNFTAHEREQD